MVHNYIKQTSDQLNAPNSNFLKDKTEQTLINKFNAPRMKKCNVISRCLIANQFEPLNRHILCNATWPSMLGSGCSRVKRKKIQPCRWNKERQNAGESSSLSTSSLRDNFYEFGRRICAGVSQFRTSSSPFLLSALTLHLTWCTLLNLGCSPTTMPARSPTKSTN